MKLLNTLVEQSLAKSKRFKLLRKSLNDLVYDVSMLAKDIINIANHVAELTQYVSKHEVFLEQILSNQKQLYKEVSGSSIDTTLPVSTDKLKKDKDKPN